MSLNQHDYPILEFDADPQAIIDPFAVLKPLDTMPEACVLCFFQDVIVNVCGDGRAQQIGTLGSEIGRNPIYALDVRPEDGHRTGQVAVVHPGVGAPLAAGFLDELIALGARKFIVCGGAGVLDRSIVIGHLIVPTLAVRDEGTSYHYLPPAREVAASVKAVAAIEATLQVHDIPYITGKTWTTDAIYRETRRKIIHRRNEGCITVEMEAAAFFAVAQFRDVVLGQLLYGGDDVSGDVWDSRGWHRQESTRARVFWLAAEAALRL
ncbi:MAG: nucleoside phosphorylase [Chloroflexota bacterium]